MKFKDIANPTDEEVREWAYHSGGEYPEEMSQDWDLMIADYSRIDLIGEIANDFGCETRSFFLSCLYLLSGQCVRYPDRINQENIAKIKDYIQKKKQDFEPSVKQWAERSIDLFERPEIFDYNKWCWHGYAYGIDDTPKESLTFLARLRKFIGAN